MNPLEKAALYYASKGWRVFPCHWPTEEGKCSCGSEDCGKSIGKHPFSKLVPNGQINATTDMEKIKSWWSKYPNANIGLLFPGLILDVDTRNGGDKTIVGKHLPATPCASTGGGGWHYLFEKNCPFTDATIAPGLDLKGDERGYIIAPPSKHASGRHYAWVENLGPDDIDIAPTPDWILDLISKHSNSKKDQRKTKDILTSIGGPGWHDAMRTVTARWVYEGWTDEEIHAATSMKRLPGYSQEKTKEEIQTLIDGARAKGFDKEDDATENDPNNQIVRIKTVGEEVMASLISGPPKFYSTTINQLNFFLCGGFQGGELIYLGARPGVGKTAFALQMARDIAITGSEVLIVSREMKNKHLMHRMISQTGKAKASELRRGNFTPEKIKDIALAIDDLSQLPIYMTDSLCNVEDIVGAVCAKKKRHGNLFVIVDYLQLLKTIAPGEKRIQIEAASKALKAMALSCDVPVLCLSSLSRPADKKNNKATMDSLRESGELEHDADIVLMMHRSFNSDQTELEVMKNRNGHVGKINLRFEQDYLTFHYLEDAQEES